MTARHDYFIAFLSALLLHGLLLTTLGGRLPGRRQPASAATPAAAPFQVHLLPAFRAPSHGAALPAASAAPAPDTAPLRSAEAPLVPEVAPVDMAAVGRRAEQLQAVAAAVIRPRMLPAAEHIKPRLKGVLDPVFPLGARLRGEEGDVRVKVLLAASGRIEAVELLESSGSPALDRSAIRAVKQARFAPALAGGRPVDGELLIRIRFRLEES